MTTTAKALSDQAVLLPPEERLALVDRLLDTLDEPDQALDALWATYRRGEVRAVHWQM
jgi:hypothetical protein